MENMNIDPPRRETGFTERCLCILTHSGSGGRTALDECIARRDDPDSPVCRDCDSAGHMDIPHVPYPEVAHERAKVSRGQGLASPGGAG